MSAIVHPTPPTEPTHPKLSPAPATVPRRNALAWKIGLIVLIVAAGGAAAYQLWSKQQARKQVPVAVIRTARAVTGALVRTIRVSGQTSTRNFALLTVPIFRGPDSRANLTLMKLAKAGSTVKKGELVAAMDAQTAQDHVDDMNDAVQQAESDIRTRKANQDVDIGTLKQTLNVAKSDWDKSQLEYRAAEVKTDIEREVLRLNMEETGARYKELQKDYPNALASDRSEIRILEITLQTQTTHRDKHVSDLQKFQVHAPIPGLVVMHSVFRSGEMAQVQEGDMVSPGQPIMRIVDTSTMQVEGTVNQTESSEFRIGQKATIGLDAFPELRFKGHIHSIGAMAIRGGRDSYYIRNVPVRVAVDGIDPRLIPDLSAWADVEVERHENIVLVPLEAVQMEEGKTVVYVKGAGGMERRVVELGPRNAIQTAVLSGLNAGEQVALERPKAAPKS